MWSVRIRQPAPKGNAGVAQLVERNFAKVKVDSSRLFTRSSKSQGRCMSSSDILKAALEKKKQKNQAPGKKSNNDTGKGVHGNQVTINKPTKKSSGRGR